MEVYQRRSQDENYYVQLSSRSGNPEFSREQSYATMPYPDSGFRLLCLYRYWSMINYFFPYRHLTDKDWNEVLRAYIPIFLEAEDELAYELATVQIIGEIQDTHANLWWGGDKIEAWKGSYYAPIHVRFIEDQLVVTDYYNPELKSEVGLDIGTVITHIDGQRVADMVEERNRYYPASNQPTRLRNIAQDILRSHSQTLNLRYSYGDSGEKTTALPLYPKDSLNIYRWYPRNVDRPSFEMLDNNIGYVTLQTIGDADHGKIRQAFADTHGIILDIRSYPARSVMYSLGTFFMSASTPFVKITNGSLKNPGEFTFVRTLEISSFRETYENKLVVLVNEHSQSNAEFQAMAFRAGVNTTVMGSTTAGADGNVSRFNLPGGLGTMISGIGINYPDGSETQRVGIVPDIEVKPTVEGIREGRDEVLEAAIKFILKD